MAANALAAARAATAAAVPRRGLDRASPGFSTSGAGQLFCTLHPPACFFQTLSLCITGDASKLRSVQQQVDFFFPDRELQ